MKDAIQVLLIEDNPVDARLVAGMLEHDENRAFTLKHVSCLEDGIRSLASGSGNQVILLDLGLPDETGLQTLRRIMPLAQDASVVVITGLQDEELGIAALREGAHDYLIKGQVDGGQLRRILRYAVERHKLHSELRAEIERRARVQQALQLSEQRYRLLSETAPMGILLADELGRVIDANMQALRMFGYERGELIGESIEMLVPERLRSSHREHRSGFNMKPNARPMGVGMELFARRKDGTEFPVEIGLGPLSTPEGLIISAAIVHVAERNKMQEQLHSAQRMETIGSLAAGVAHDFNNLLGVILACSETLTDQLTGNHPALHKIEMVRKAASSAADLTRQLLAFGRKQILLPRVIEPREILESVGDMLRRLMGENINLAVRIEPAVGCISADPGQVEQILVNLAANAKDAMPDGGKLSIEVSNVDLDQSYKKQHLRVVPGAYVMFALSDTGCGMDRNTQSRIFEPFFTTKKFGKGTGLGLATVYGIVKQSGGYIEVYSEMGKGTAFKVYLPRTERTVPPRAHPDPEGVAQRGSETILLAEDSDALREIAREYLQSLGYTVIEAGSGEQGLRRANEFNGEIHLLLTDVVMPEMSGRQLADQIVSKRPGIKVLFPSGYTDEAIVRHGVLEQGLNFIQKPYRPRALARKIREVLGEPAPRDESPVPVRSHPSSIT